MQPLRDLLLCFHKPPIAAGAPGLDLSIGAGFWLSERALHACRKFRARDHFYGQFWQAFPKGFRRPKATTFQKNSARRARKSLLNLNTGFSSIICVARTCHKASHCLFVYLPKITIPTAGQNVSRRQTLQSCENV